MKRTSDSSSASFLKLTSLLCLALAGCDYGPPPSQAPTANTPPGNTAPTNPTPITQPTSPTPPVTPAPSPPTAAVPPENPAVAASVSYLENAKAVSELLVTVVDTPSAQAAAEPLRKLAEQQRPLIRPFWLWAATLSGDAKVKFANDQAIATREFEQKHGSAATGPGKQAELIRIAKEPGNEAFKSALAALFRANIDESPRTAAANYQKLLDKLNQ